jgi:hypothetical protein
VFKKNQPIAGYLGRELALETGAFDAPTSSKQLTGNIVRPDSSWRITDTDVFAAMGWTSGCTLSFERTASGYCLELTSPAYRGLVGRIDKRTRLLLPSRVRDALRVQPCQPLLLIADPEAAQATLITLPTIYRSLKEAS